MKLRSKMKYLSEEIGAQTVLQKWYGPKYAFCPGRNRIARYGAWYGWPNLLWGAMGCWPYHVVRVPSTAPSP